MARGRRKYSLDEKIELVTKEIEETQTKLQELKAELKELSVQKGNEDLKKIKDAIETSGKTIEEIISMIQ